ncbi:RNA-binding protein 1-like isoform X2 [Ananas comosus]|uniref:RNA-binding protein 1-like isoform X2 n=1 Tax=Ananas comosus TaxID=4615 RepID=A0A6P5H6L5_ANACO|nr:RNA-binding protein 1-like isoform X2 [Ananas comosus]
MADGYWRYGADARHPPPHAAAAAAAAVAPSPVSLKRPRSGYADVPAGPEIAGYYPRDEGRAGYRAVKDTEAIGASYDRYLRDGMASFGASEPARPAAGGITGNPIANQRIMAGGRPELPSLPPDASSTLFVEGLPSNCTRREVSHIFRPFVGFREVRLVNREPRHPGGDPHILCFVDFSTPAQAAVALDALQGYKFDEHDRESPNMRLQFSRSPGPKSSGGPRGRR